MLLKWSVCWFSKRNVQQSCLWALGVWFEWGWGRSERRMLSVTMSSDVNINSMARANLTLNFFLMGAENIKMF